MVRGGYVKKCTPHTMRKRRDSWACFQGFYFYCRTGRRGVGDRVLDFVEKFVHPWFKLELGYEK